MKQGRFGEEQIVGVLKEGEDGVKVAELCRRHGISDATFYNWRSRYGGLEVSELRRLRQLEEENWRLKSIVADQALDIRALSRLREKAEISVDFLLRFEIAGRVETERSGQRLWRKGVVGSLGSIAGSVPVDLCRCGQQVAHPD
jgi:putative transposase